MGNCTVTIKKKSDRPFGRSTIAQVNLSSSYAAGGDTLPRSLLKIGNRLSMLILGSSVLSPTGHTVEVVYGATEYVDPKLRVRDVATGTEVGAIDLSASSILVEAIASPYK